MTGGRGRGSGRAAGSGRPGSGGRGAGRGSTGKPAGRAATGKGATGRGSSAGRGKGSAGGFRPPATRVQRPADKPIKRGPRIGRERRGVGGEQVEGRQAVRELLLAGTRKVQEIWIAGDTEAAPILDDIRELAASARIPVRDVSKGKFASQARCEAPDRKSVV